MDSIQPDSKRPRIAPHSQPQPSPHQPLPQIQTVSPSHSSQLPPPPPSHHPPGGAQVQHRHPQQHYPIHQQPHQPPPHPPPPHHHPPPAGHHPSGPYQHHPPPPPPSQSQHQSQQQPPTPQAQQHQHALPPPGPPTHPSYPARSAPSPTSAQQPHAPPSHGAPLRRPESDRRHHEQEPYAPMQHEHYRPQLPPSPAHGGHYPPRQYQPAPARDAVVKRENSGYDDQGRRSNSIGHALEGAPPVQHMQGSSQQQQQQQHPPYASEHPRHMSYEHGSASMPPTPGGYGARPAYPPPTPIQQHYEQPAYAIQAPEIQFNTAGSKPKKNTRASQACDSCRSLKAKCDENKPCKTCVDKGINCHYQATAPKAADKAQADILDNLENLRTMQADLKAMLGIKFTDLQAQIDGLKNGGYSLAKQGSQYGDDHKPSPHTHSNGTSEFHSIGATPRDNATETAPSDTTVQAPFASAGMANLLSGSFEHDEKADSESGAPLPPGQDAIPHNHTTLAGLLLHWPAIRELTENHLKEHYEGPMDQFPIWTEENRGSLLLYGCGEDNDAPGMTTRERRRANLTGETPESTPNVPSPPNTTDYGLVGNSMSMDFDESPNFSEERVNQLFKSFEEHIFSMHPVVQYSKLEKWKDEFLTFIHRKGGQKRKRDEWENGASVRTPNYNQATSPAKPDRSLKSALMLVILALGAICEHRDHIPDVARVDEDVRSTSGQTPASPMMQGSPGDMMPPSRHSNYASPNYHSPGAIGMSSPVASRPTPDNGLLGESRSVWRKNSDVIPGLKYFRLATDILGNNIGTNSMMNVYANIFTSLYYGQLGRPLQSYSHIHAASSKLLVVMRPQMTRLNNLKKSMKPSDSIYDLELTIAFWTCLQLESDLIAELPLPPSGVLSYEDGIPYPNMAHIWQSNEAEPKVQRVRESYMAQLYLRRHLNEIHRTFYAPETDSNGGEFETPGAPGADRKRVPTFVEAKAIADSVESLEWTSPRFQFDQSDAPACEILAARLRAKFWGAMMITYRPFIRQILDFSQAIKHNPDNPSLAQGSQAGGFRAGFKAPRITQNARTSGDIDPIIMECATKAIKALTESTRAFHGLGDGRPIITNVFGTAHAQWGNLLTLTACWKDPILGPYVNEDTLKDLFVRTIWFLQESETRTSSLKVDRKILSGMYTTYWGPLPMRDGKRRERNDSQMRFVDPKHQRVITGM